MKLHTLALSNIGPYLDVQIDFTTKKLKGENLILFGGKNGAGKTTLLNAMKIALYGVNAFGFKSEGSTYFQEIRKLLNYKSLKKADSRYFIEIVYEEIENFQTNVYAVKREWRLENEKISEVATVRVNGKALKPIEVVTFQEQLRQKYPMKVMESFLFDGEKINRHIIENTTGEYIRETIAALFQIELFDQLDRDLNAYLQTMEANKVLSEHEVELLHKKNALLSQKRNLVVLEQKKKNIAQEYKQLLADKESIHQKLQSLGYLSKKQGEQLRQEMKDVEQQKKERNERVRTFMNDHYFFAATTPLLRRALAQLENEYPFQLQRRLNELEAYLGSNPAIEQLRQQIVIDETKLAIHEPVEFENMQAIEQFLQTEETEKTSFLATVSQPLADLEMLREMVAIQETTDEVKALVEVLNTFTQKQETYQHQSEQVEQDLRTETLRQEQLQAEYEALKQKNQSQKSSTGSLTLAENYLQVIAKFKEVQVQKIITELEERVLVKFNRVIRKKDYVRKIQIDPQTFDVTLYDMDHDQKAIGLLSAGESQILMGSIIFTLFELAKYQMFFVYDTPVGRLDHENRLNFVKEIILQSGEQVIVLSTNTEIVGELYEAVKPNVAQTYVMNFDELKVSTEITPGYFE